MVPAGAVGLPAGLGAGLIAPFLYTATKAYGSLLRTTTSTASPTFIPCLVLVTVTFVSFLFGLVYCRLTLLAFGTAVTFAAIMMVPTGAVGFTVGLPAPLLVTFFTTHVCASTVTLTGSLALNPCLAFVTLVAT
ncbi:hypothetical protein PBCV1_a142L [Paramecium bursaria Chlorella virus 1]|uniref:Uncharacterized protein n=1 Tax=Paramecium bursaria Chlorella virus 1 TaxID=10506 RepID=Q84462_PBCV1|nr:hypothetical protein PBCV1_a142L [Paramecium bursaria Chlorella virus 1]AAC96510.1 hypothetical protein [Paramecium bursaria Chlorella virus 1]